MTKDALLNALLVIGIMCVVGYVLILAFTKKD